MNLWLQLKQNIAKELKVDINQIEEPENFGDLAFPIFKKEIDASKIGKIEFIKEIKQTGPYINFYINWSEFGNELLKSIDKNYGRDNKEETIIMDVFQANPFKSFHIGHIRNAVLGESIRRILEFTGRKTITVNYNGDVGIHVARWLLYFKNYYKGDIPKENFTKWSGEIYAKASLKAKKDPEFEKQAQELNRKIDKRDKSIITDWKKIRDLCYKDYDRIKKELGVKVDAMFPESECEEPGKKLVLDLFDKGKLIKSEGAIGIDLEKYGLGFFILLKTDGTAIYATKDFGLLQLKRQYKFDKMIYIVGSEHNHYFRQLFKTYDLLGLHPLEKSVHVSYGLVNLKEGKMASRLGNVILYEDLRDEAISRVKKEIEKRNPDLKDKEEAARKIAMGAIKFSMLYLENKKPIKFDWDEVLNFEGRSGPYLQYSYVRASSILEKEKPKKFDASELGEEIEVKIMKQIAKFPSVIQQSADKYAPYIICTYLFQLAQDFNSFYNSVPVLKSERKESRLKLVETVRTVLKTGLELLGVEAVEKM